MKKFLQFLFVIISLTTTVVFAQSGASSEKNERSVILAKNNPENALYSQDDFYVSNVYPNPADEYIQIDYAIPANGAKVKLAFRNILGSLVSEYTLGSDKKKIKINTSELAPGIYFHTLYIDNKTIVTKKLVIKR
jgi:hypothetical protein